jgi:hypothetical protein
MQLFCVLLVGLCLVSSLLLVVVDGGGGVGKKVGMMILFLVDLRLL